ncbi:phosphoglycerate mutase-like protein 4 [Mercurialis annua]|uniref:phosphoglycerate mutase-like protein 4 n=1 Tax=Mercurialis annua TaxID=3986 RepID=UPI0021604FE2|nr:phosphoglycerate mutase-like protein 4 [Mercurialis annua]
MAHINSLENGVAAKDYTEIIVVRHGETPWNCDGRIQGHLDVELNDVGRQQAVAVADRLANESEISAIYSSDLKRARETAQIIASKCNVLEVTEDPDLRERHLGELQGLVYREAAKLKPDAFKATLPLSRTDQEIPGGGESLDQVYNRCTISLQKIGRNHKGQRVVVVTHGGVVRAFHKYAAPKEESPGKIRNASINIFHIDGDDNCTLTTWGDISHLSDTGFLESAFGGDGNSG